MSDSFITPNFKVAPGTQVQTGRRIKKFELKKSAIEVINCELGKEDAGCLTNFCAAVAACAFADLSALLDANGNELLVLDTVAEATNFVTLANAATGGNPVFTAGGSDANVGLNFKTKGTGVFNFLATASGPTDIRWFEDADNGTNYVSVIAPATLAGNVVLTLPDATDTLIGKATTDNLTNKTLMTVNADKTITAIGTTGGVTIDKPAGCLNVAIGASSVVLTNSLITANSLVFVTLRTVDATFTQILNVVYGAGSVTITGNATATAATRIDFLVVN